MAAEAPVIVEAVGLDELDGVVTTADSSARPSLRWYVSLERAERELLVWLVVARRSDKLASEVDEDGLEKSQRLEGLFDLLFVPEGEGSDLPEGAVEEGGGRKAALPVPALNGDGMVDTLSAEPEGRARDPPCLGSYTMRYRAANRGEAWLWEYRRSAAWAPRRTCSGSVDLPALLDKGQRRGPRVSASTSRLQVYAEDGRGVSE